jgi:hypothetical protein
VHTHTHTRFNGQIDRGREHNASSVRHGLDDSTNRTEGVAELFPIVVVQVRLYEHRFRLEVPPDGLADSVCVCVFGNVCV